jgi:hypothetical protein
MQEELIFPEDKDPAFLDEQYFALHLRLQQADHKLCPI